MDSEETINIYNNEIGQEEDITIQPDTRNDLQSLKLYTPSPIGLPKKKSKNKNISGAKLKQVTCHTNNTIFSKPINNKRQPTCFDIECLQNWIGPIEYDSQILEICLYLDKEILYNSYISKDYKLLLYILKFTLKLTQEYFDDVYNYIEENLDIE